jgi:hypothetical protein
MHGDIFFNRAEVAVALRQALDRVEAELAGDQAAA